MGFRLVPKAVTLNGIMTIILGYFVEFGRFYGQFPISGWLAIDIGGETPLARALMWGIPLSLAKKIDHNLETVQDRR